MDALHCIVKVYSELCFVRNRKSAFLHYMIVVPGDPQRSTYACYQPVLIRLTPHSLSGASDRGCASQGRRPCDLSCLSRSTTEPRYTGNAALWLTWIKNVRVRHCAVRSLHCPRSFQKAGSRLTVRRFDSSPRQSGWLRENSWPYWRKAGRTSTHQTRYALTA